MSGQDLATRVRAMISSGVRESLTVDYKRDMYPSTEGGRKEFAKDLAGFANRDGGLLVVGIDEVDGAPGDIVGLDPRSVDAAILWFESVARSGLTPHLPGLTINQVDLNGKAVIALAVPRGLDPPYEVPSAGARFFVRDERSVRTMSREELKFAATRAGDLAERINLFVARRWDALLSALRETVSTPPAQGAMLLVTPIFDESVVFRADMPTVFAQVPHMRSLEQRMVGTGKPRIDGLLYEFDEVPGQYRGRARLFRHGAVEIVDGYLCGVRNDGNPIPGTLLVNGLIGSISDATACSRKVTGAEAFAIDFRMRVRSGQEIAFYNHFSGRSSTDRADLVFDQLVLSWGELAQTDRAAAVRPLLDQLWQAFGYHNCTYFKDDGTWQPP